MMGSHWTVEGYEGQNPKTSLIRQAPDYETALRFVKQHLMVKQLARVDAPPDAPEEQVEHLSHLGMVFANNDRHELSLN